MGMQHKAGWAGRVAAAALSAGMALSMGAPALALAATTDGNGNGVQSQSEEVGIDYQSFVTTKDGNGEGAWQDSNNEKGTEGDYYQDGKVHLFYDTTGASGGSWWEPGKDTTVPGPDGDGDPSNPGTDTDVKHPNGTFVVTIPTKIAYEGMNVGKVSTSDDYTVNVRGVIGESQTVTLEAETGNFLANGSKTQEIQETTTQGKTTWTSADTYGHLDEDGSIWGTDTTDNISLSGEVTTSGVYEGSVTYVATLS